MTAPITPSGWAELHDRVGSLEASVRIVANGHVQLVEQIAEITVSQRRADLQMREQSQGIKDIASSLSSQDDQIRENRDSLVAICSEVRKNTAVQTEILDATRDLRDVVITAKTGGKFAKWLAPTLIATAAAAAVVKGWAEGLSHWFDR